MNYYTVFDRNDEILAFGDDNECAQKVGFKNVRQFYAFVSKTKSGLYKYNSVVVDKDFETETV